MATESSLRNSDNYGLNKERRLAAAERARGRLEPRNLEPDFPWDVVGFADSYFGAQSSEPDAAAEG